MANLKIIESVRSIEQKINKSLATQVNKVLPKAATRIKSRILELATFALSTSPEIASLSNGSLRGDFGLTSNVAGPLVDAIVSTLDVKVNKVNNNLQGGITLVMQPSDFSNLFSLPFAYQPIEGGNIPWLEWLLTLGDAVIIADFGVELGSGLGRSGKGHMVVGGPYKVNSAYSGVPDNNFITRAIAKVSPQIKEVILKAI